MLDIKDFDITDLSLSVSHSATFFWGTSSSHSSGKSESLLSLQYALYSWMNEYRVYPMNMNMQFMKYLWNLYKFVSVNKIRFIKSLITNNVHQYKSIYLPVCYLVSLLLNGLHPPLKRWFLFHFPFWHLVWVPFVAHVDSNLLYFNHYLLSRGFGVLGFWGFGV